MALSLPSLQERTRIIAAAAARTALAGGVLLRAGASPLWSAGDQQVRIDNFAFAPGTLTISPGTEVTWTNEDDIPHTVVLMDGSARSKALDSEETFSHRFEKAGTYTYICGLHPHMHGEIVVR